MKTINIFTKGNNTVCYIENNEKTNYVTFSEIKDKINEVCSNYDKITITPQNIIMFKSNIKLNIENYKNNTNVLLEPIIMKSQKEYRDLKNKRLRKQKIKRISTFSFAVLISSGIVVNSLTIDNKVNSSNDYETDYLKTNTNQTIIIEKEQQPINNYIIEEVDEQSKNIIVNEENINSSKELEISFESRVDNNKFQITKAYYNDLISKISNEYGIDPRIMLAIATQECGIHNPELGGPATGLMQIELSVWKGQTISAYNYEKCINETLNITEEKLKDLEFNIRTACMIFKECLKKTNYNLPVAIQMYNFGYGNIEKIFKYTYGDSNIEKICLDCDNSWLENREYIKEGDNKYLEHILSYIENLEDIQIKTDDGIVQYRIINKTKTL